MRQSRLDTATRAIGWADLVLGLVTMPVALLVREWQWFYGLGLVAFGAFLAVMNSYRLSDLDDQEIEREMRDTAAGRRES